MVSGLRGESPSDVPHPLTVQQHLPDCPLTAKARDRSAQVRRN